MHYNVFNAVFFNRVLIQGEQEAVVLPVVELKEGEMVEVAKLNKKAGVNEKLIVKFLITTLVYK